MSETIPEPDYSTPRMIDDECFRCLRGGDIDCFHQAAINRDSIDLSGGNFRGVDFRGADLSRVILTHTYLREADLRGQDFRQHNLNGCTLRNAKVSGVFFPENISAEEIRMSLQFGTRIRQPR